MSSYNLLLTSNIQDVGIKRTMPRKRIHGTPIFVNNKLVVKPETIQQKQYFIYVFGEKVRISVRESEEMIRMGITVEQELVVICRK